MDDLTHEFLLESQEGLDRMERGLTELESRPADSGLLAEIFRSVHTVKGATGFLGFPRLEALAHGGENLLGRLHDGRLTADAEIISGLLALLDRLRGILHSIETTGGEGEAGLEDRAMIARLEALQRSDASTDAGASAMPAAPSAEQSTTDSTLRVEIELLNRIMNLVGELVLTRNQILQATSADAAFGPLGRRLDMVTADLREAVMKARMQPVSHVFSRFPRLVRDLARSLGKPVRLELEGQETELDKSLLEAIRDPLTHAIRNAVDHGIEKPDTRAAAGKPAEGLVRLCARHQGSHVIVEVHDDGAGMNIERIRAKAVDRGLVPPSRAARMSEREVLQLVFLPGFSTAEAVTSVSGRGVGMDVVRTNVEAIGGKVEIDSTPGRGTILRLRIPLTLAIIPTLIVRSRGQNFAIPQSALIELVHLSGEEAANRIEWLENAALYRLRGHLLPLIFLDRLLHQPAQEPGDCDIAVLNADGRRFGLVVDDLADPEEIVVKPLAAILRHIGYYAGATILGNGEMALILHPGAIAQSAGIGLTEEAPESALDEDARAGLNDFLVVETAGRERALPLETVVRIERIPRSRIERAGSRPVLRLHEELLPIDGMEEDVTDPEAQTTVVVCRDGPRQIGLLVSRVLDVAPGSALREAGTEITAAGVALLRDRVTGIVLPASVPALEEERAMALPEAQP